MTTPADWQGFAEMTGGASGALTGLLFVAVSLNAMLLFVVSGIILAYGESSGLYLLLPASLVALMSGVLNARHFLLPPSSG